MKTNENISETSVVTKTFVATTVKLERVKLVLGPPKRPVGQVDKILLQFKVGGGEERIISVHEVMKKILEEQRVATLFNRLKTVMPFQITVVETAGKYSLSEDTAMSWAEAARFRKSVQCPDQIAV